MINANELRIGNYVMLNNPQHRPRETGKVHVIDNINKEDASVFELYELPYSPIYGQFLKYLDGIPLTEEWLFKFGFEKEKVHGKTKCYKINNLSIDLHDFSVNLDPNIYNSVYLCETEYVHQLQNAYFVASQGKELETI